MTNRVFFLGATSDIAMATGKVFAQEGFSLLLGARNPERLLPYCRDIEVNQKVSAEVVEFDATKVEDHAAQLSSISEDFCVVIYTAGYLSESSAADPEELERILFSNYVGAISILELIAERWIKSGHKGTIIGISSVAGDRGRMSNYIYGSAKAGLTTYLSGLRNRLYHRGIQVTTIKPGFVATKMTDHLNLPQPLTASKYQVAKAIFKAYQRKKSTVYVLGIWRFIMLIITSIPEPVFKRMKL